MNEANSGWHGTVTSYPELYDLLHAENQADVPLYLRMTEPGEDVLEGGIGTGRVAIPLARAGRIVHGIDGSPEMLAALDRRLESEPEEVRARVHAHLADMRSFNLGRSFRFAYIPFMTFNYLADIQSQLGCLTRFLEHLQPGGYLVFELMSLYKEWFHNDGIPRLVRRKTEPETGAAIEVFRVTRFDPSTQVMEHDRHYRHLDAGGRLEQERVVTLRNRFFFLGEARLLLERAGFELLDVWGDHHGGPYTSESQIMVLCARRPRQ